MSDWSDYRRGTNGFELSENGWGALTAWCVGPAHVHWDDAGPAESVVTTLTTNGRARQFSSPRTLEDQSEIDGDIDDYLRNAGVPARPRDRRWLLTPPPGETDLRSFYGPVNDALSQLSSHNPAEVAREIRRVVARLYGHSTSI